VSRGEVVDIADIEAARRTVGRLVRHTPVVPAGGSVVYKAENLQSIGAFKIRGAMNKLASLGDGARRGVTAGSAGNHAQALAYAARHFRVPCELFVPAGASVTKIAGCQALGARIREVGASLAEAVVASQAHSRESGMAFCHPYDDPHVIAGQGTLGLELLEDLPELGCVIIPLGGGGLAAGTAIAVKTRRPHVRIIGVQASACAPYIGGVVPDGTVTTLADGIAVKHPGELTRPLVDRYVDEIVTVDEAAIAAAMVHLIEDARLVVEGAGAVGVAALAADPSLAARQGTTCVVLSGGNVDLGTVPGLIRRHETSAGRRLSIFSLIDDRPGGLAQFLAAFAAVGANLIEVEHVREGVDLDVRETGVRATFEVRGRDHAEKVLAAVRAADYPVSAGAESNCARRR
jgi:threonine dehydratase